MPAVSSHLEVSAPAQAPADPAKSQEFQQMVAKFCVQNMQPVMDKSKEAIEKLVNKDEDEDDDDAVDEQ
jgi:hypothetical protein